ncbi:hypothetical protein GRJ2_000784300 [Grus japonensis]|uniref:Uncharacterized protein n=1 Tax=Grus japonensis TaxID=30415 RepID=A0ABC9WCE2_GRUJA
MIWRDIKPASRDSGQLAKSMAGSCPVRLLPSSQLPDGLHHSPPGRMPYPFAGCLICRWSALWLPSQLVEWLELALQLPACPGVHLVFGISSRQMGQNGPFAFARDSRLLTFHSNVKQTKASTTQDHL